MLLVSFIFFRNRNELRILVGSERMIVKGRSRFLYCDVSMIYINNNIMVKIMMVLLFCLVLLNDRFF